MSLAELRKRAESLGYSIKRCFHSVLLGRQVQYATLPMCAGGGTTNTFETKEQIAKYLDQVAQNREWEAESMSP